MHQTPRIRVLSDRIPRVLVFVYFYRGLSENMEGRPTRRVYIKIIMCAAIFLNLEESRSYGNERESEQARGQGAHPPPRTPALMMQPIRLRLLDRAPPPLIFKENRVIKVGFIRRPTFIWGGYISKASPPQGERRNHYQRKPSKLGFRNFSPAEN